MSAINTGGPAFPQPMLDTKGGSGIVVSEEMDFGGMTLRDYFAAHAPITMDDARQALLGIGVKETSGGKLMDLLCEMRIAYADTMIAVREKGGS